MSGALYWQMAGGSEPESSDVGNVMNTMFQRAKVMVRRSLERDRSIERYVETASRWLWPWQESRLSVLVGLLAVLDFVSTYTVLVLSDKRHIHEGGILAGWALQRGGFGGLLLIDMAAVIILSLVAVTARFLYFKFGFNGFGRAAFVALLIPYALVGAVATINNFLLALL